MKRQRGRGRKPGGGGGHHSNQGGHHPNRTLESNGPEIKVRGPAAHIYERYLQLARDAASSGDRVLSENYMQHADHYFRMVRAMQPATPAPQPQADRFSEGGFEGEEEGAPETEGAEGSEVRAESDEQPEADYAQQADRPPREGGGDGEGRRRGRNRRNRFRPDGEREGGYEARENEDRRDRSEDGEPQREPRRERQPRERDGDREQAGPEGFSSGPKPAFLRSGGE